MILHIINKSPNASQAITNCQAAMSPEDHVLFIEDGVYHGLHAAMSIPKAQCHYLANDVIARGLTQQIEQQQLIDDNQFVELVIRCQSSTNWS